MIAKRMSQLHRRSQNCDQMNELNLIHLEPSNRENKYVDVFYDKNRGVTIEDATVIDVQGQIGKKKKVTNINNNIHSQLQGSPLQGS